MQTTSSRKELAYVQYTQRLMAIEQQGYESGYESEGLPWPEALRFSVNPYEQSDLARVWSDGWLRGRDRKRDAMMLLEQAKKEDAQ